MIIGLLKLTQSSLSKWSKALPGEKELEATYKQLQRFARFFRFSPACIVKYLGLVRTGESSVSNVRSLSVEDAWQVATSDHDWYGSAGYEHPCALAGL